MEKKMTSASNNSKKRKIYREEEDEEKQEEEEAKMETFFALVRSMRETRERWCNSRSGNDDIEGKNIITERKEEIRVDVWKPTFQVEDFAEEDAQHRNLKPTSESNNCAEKDDAEKGTIDLKLSL